MVKEKKRIEIARALRSHGTRVIRDSGPHQVWQCPCGGHQTSLPRHTEITTSTTNKIHKQMAGCQHFGKDWLR